MSRSTGGKESSILDADRRIEVLLVNRAVDQLLVQLIDHCSDSVTKVVPSPPCRLVSTTEPLHRLVEFRLFVPLRWRGVFFEVLVQHHLEHWDRVIGERADTAVKRM